MTGIYKDYPSHLKTVGARAVWEAAQQLGMRPIEMKPIVDVFMIKAKERFGEEFIEKDFSKPVDSFTDNGASTVALSLKLFAEDYAVRGEDAELPVLRM